MSESKARTMRVKNYFGLCVISQVLVLIQSKYCSFNSDLSNTLVVNGVSYCGQLCVVTPSCTQFYICTQLDINLCVKFVLHADGPAACNGNMDNNIKCAVYKKEDTVPTTTTTPTTTKAPCPNPKFCAGR